MMDVKRAIAELTSQVSEINYDSDEEAVLQDAQTLDDSQDPAEYEMGTSKLRKVTESPIFSERVYGGKKTTRKKTYSLSDSSSNDDIFETASLDGSSDHTTGSCNEDGNEKEFESDTDTSYSENKKAISSQGKEATQNEALDFNIYSAGSKNVSSDIRKGTAIRNQLRVWEHLLECRIKLQNGLVACNNLPPSIDLLKTKTELNSEDQLKLNKCKKNLLSLLDKMVDLEKNLMKQCCEFKAENYVHSDETDEEMKSDLSDIEESFEEKEDQHERKRRKLNDYSSAITINHSNFISFRNAAIQKWNDKTKISTGKLANSNFSAFDQSTLKQIEQIMTEKNRLINRTRIKRREYRKVEDKKQENFTHDSKDNIVDAEIFDDTDFYHKLLRDYIERKSADAANSTHTERQMIELQKLRSKMKKDVDTKSTKGRKLRFVVLPKLVNFMASHPYNSWSQQAEAELFSSLFGNIKVAN